MVDQLEQPEAPPHSIESIQTEEAKKILAQSKIHGVPFKGESLTTYILEKEGLLPKHKIGLSDDVILYSSDPYIISAGRLGVAAYIEKDGVISVRSYYKSNSHGVWKYIPHYTMEDDRLDWYGKGHNEQSVTLPIASQKALSEITKDESMIAHAQNPELILVGTTRRELSDATYNFINLAEPQRLTNIPYHTSEHEKTPPEQLILTDEESPDFSSALFHWEQDTNLYGIISVEVFASKNGRLKYMFCKDNLGRVWIGGIENDSEIQSTGVKKTWVDGGDLTTPAYGYVSDNIEDTKKYGNEKMLKGRYVDFFEKYLKKVPVIQEYIKSESLRKSKKIEQKDQNEYRDAKDFKALEEKLYANGDIRIDNGKISAEVLTSIIEQYRRGTALIEDIPETGGLRARVEELDKIDKIGETF